MAAGGGNKDQQQENRQRNVNIGVACPDDDAVVVVEQQIAVQRIGPRPYRKKETEKSRAVGNGGGRNVPGPAVQMNSAEDQIHRSGRESTREQDQQHPGLDRNVDRQREEVETDVLVKLRIVLTVWHLVEEPKDRVPLTDLPHRDQQSDDEGHSQDEQAPRQQRRRRSEQPGRRPRQCQNRREARVAHYRKPKSSLPRKPQ
jgi:hypothetical protein